MAGRVRNWWGRISPLKRTLAVMAVIVGLVVVGLPVYLLQPDASIDDFADYEVDDQEALQPEQVGVTFFGVSSLLFDDGTDQILIDAFFTRPSKLEFLGEMEQNPEAVAGFIEDFGIDRLGAVFVAHSHVDHAIDVPAVAAQTGAQIYGTESTLNIGRGGDVPETQLVLAGQGDVVQVGEFTVEVFDTPHSQIPGIPAPMSPPTIDAPLLQPASNEAFAEGGNLSFVITHRDQVFAVVPSANSRPGMLDGIDADVAFIATALLGMQEDDYQQAYLDETISTVSPDIVIPLHWDDFISPWKRGEAKFNPRLIDSEPVKGFELLIDRTESIGGRFVLLQSGSRIVLGG